MSPRKAAALRDRDDADLRAHLVATARRLIAEQGGAGLTVRAIARAAGVADGVLYNHFADKEELLAAALRAHVDAVHAELTPPPTPGAGTLAQNLLGWLDHGLALHRGILPVFTQLLAHPAVLTRYAQTPGTQPDWRDALTTHLIAERALGRITPTADLDATTAILVGICHDAVLSALFPGGPPHPTTTPTAVITTLLPSLTP
ncbi:TetR/AcrR family transcriptional regulator [Nocardia sp. NPDC004068]|uniref:TetR/AcrR family transcriptional regulator n=1 Tax=Nocardia sp. NPDC004068 TaxID=3364303 RepID=UPI0036B9B717